MSMKMKKLLSSLELFIKEKKNEILKNLKPRHLTHVI